MNITPCVDRQFSIVFKECDEICHLDCNECFEFIAIWKCLHVPEDKSKRRNSLAIEENFLLEYDNYAMKIFKLFSVIECQGG